MVENINVTIYKKKTRVHVSKSLSIVKGWAMAGSVVAESIGGPEYSPIPYIVDTHAYQIGHIFVQEDSEIQCFCAAPQLKVLGPVRDFVVQQKTNPRWLDKELPVIKSTGDRVNYRVEFENSKNTIRFKAFDCFFLDKAPDMSVEGDVTIDRSSHEDLSQAEWFGLITGVFIAEVSHLILVRGQQERAFYIGEKPHTIFFKYDICKIDHKGTVHETSSEKMECKWLPVQERDLDTLPLTEFVSQSTKIKT